MGQAVSRFRAPERRATPGRDVATNDEPKKNKIDGWQLAFDRFDDIMFIGGFSFFVFAIQILAIPYLTPVILGTALLAAILRHGRMIMLNWQNKHPHNQTIGSRLFQSLFSVGVVGGIGLALVMTTINMEEGIVTGWAPGAWVFAFVFAAFALNYGTMQLLGAYKANPAERGALLFKGFLLYGTAITAAFWLTGAFGLMAPLFSKPYTLAHLLPWQLLPVAGVLGVMGYVALKNLKQSYHTFSYMWNPNDFPGRYWADVALLFAGFAVLATGFTFAMLDMSGVLHWVINPYAVLMIGMVAAMLTNSWPENHGVSYSYELKAIKPEDNEVPPCFKRVLAIRHAGEHTPQFVEDASASLAVSAGAR